MTWWGWLLLGAAFGCAATLAVQLALRRAPAGAIPVPLPPRPPDVPGAAEEQRRQEEAKHTADQAAADPDPGKTASDIMRRP